MSMSSEFPPIGLPAAPTHHAVIQDGPFRWLHYHDPIAVILATELDEVNRKLQEIDAAVNQDGLHAAGFIAYEAAPAFDPALKVNSPSPLPLLWFGIYPPPEVVSVPAGGDPHSFRLGEWRPSISEAGYHRNLARIKDYIAAGETYQVNYTLRLRAPFTGSAWDFFLQLAHAQQGLYAAYLDTGPFAICSASPELFFQLQHDELVSMPMKGTAPRGLTAREDQVQIHWLAGSEKNRAENLMIVDMIRNDMGRVAQIGSVQVPQLFAVERYPTLLQMTSTVRSCTLASLPEIFAALFPCASITGAPKVRTMQIIADLEQEPRGIYTGCIGYLAPGRQARFNVAIRTVAIDRQQGQAEYGVGGGIVWDSTPGDEYQECQIKARVLTQPQPEFDLLESLLWEPDSGYFLLEAHLQRLAESGEYFGFTLDLAEIRQALVARVQVLPPVPHKVRLLVTRGGVPHLEAAPLDPTPEPAEPASLRVSLACEPVLASDPFLYHKTTHRQVYERARPQATPCDEILLWNERGELTEARTANLVVDRRGTLLTPPVASGLLAGTFRDSLLAQGSLREVVLKVDQLESTDRLYLINSVRRWRPAELVH